MKKVENGQPLKIPASTYNQFVDMANYLGAPQNINRQSKTDNRIQQFVNNLTTGTDALPIYSVVDLDVYPLGVTPYANLSIEKIVLRGSNPVSPARSQIRNPQTANTKRIGITQEPLLENQVGNIMVMGVSKVKIKKQIGLDETLQMNVKKINNDKTKMEVTNDHTPDRLLWHNFDFTLGIVHLGYNTINPEPFVGIMGVDTVGTGISALYTIFVRDYYTGKKYSVDDGVSKYENLSLKPPRPKSTAVMAQFRYSNAGKNYVSFRPLYRTDDVSVVKYDQLEKTLNNTVFGRRSKADRIWWGDGVNINSGVSEIWRNHTP